MPRGPHDDEIQQPRPEPERDHARERLEQFRRQRDAGPESDTQAVPEKKDKDIPDQTGR
jgi:hypothetical protein